MYYIPQPDYRGYVSSTPDPSTFVAPENLIPPPDYARYEPKVDYELPVKVEPKTRPRLPSLKKDVIVEETIQDREVGEKIMYPRNYTPSNDVKKSHKPLTIQISPSESIKAPPKEIERERETRNLEKLSHTGKSVFDQPYAVHSYLEDKDKLDMDSFLNESTRSHIRSIGVPVLPPIGGRNYVQSFGGQLPAQNKAFIRHLENHRKFDTMKSLKSCKDCPLCQMMLSQGFQDELEDRYRRPDVRNIFESEAEVDWTLTRRSFTERVEGEISVGFKEKVQVIRTEHTHALCRKTDGTMGWLPLSVLQAI